MSSPLKMDPAVKRLQLISQLDRMMDAQLHRLLRRHGNNNDHKLTFDELKARHRLNRLGGELQWWETWGNREVAITRRT